MANTKLTDETALGGVPDDADLIPIVDVSDTTDDSAGSSKSVTYANLVNKTGADANLVSGTAGTSGNCGQWNADGDLVDGKALPSGTIVGTTDTQTLTNKTITMAGALSCADNTVSRPKLIDYGETVNAIGSIGGGTQDIDLELGNVVSGTVDTSTTTFTFSNPPASGTAGSFTLFLTNGGSQTVNWPASVDWAGGTAPTLTTSGVDILTFTTIDGGTIWYGFAAGLDMQ